MRRIATWGEFVLDPSPTLLSWVKNTCDTVEILVHVDDPTPGAKAEFFTCSNGGLTVGRTLEIANQLGLAAIINVDWHYGNGRSDDGGSKTGHGPYHYSLQEGGVFDAVRQVLSWRHNYNIIGIQVGNEQKAPDDWYAAIVSRVSALTRTRGLELIVGGKGSNMIVGAYNGATVVDPHLLRDDWQARLSAAKAIGKKVWVTEMGPTSTPHNEMLESVARQVGNDGAISVFTGNRINFPHPRHTYWNFKNHAPPFQAWSNAGLTPIGRAWQEFAGQPLPPDEEDLTVEDKDRIKNIVKRLEEKVEHRLEEAIDADEWRQLVRKANRQLGREIARLTDIADDD